MSQDWSNGLVPGDFARYRDGTIVRVLEVVERWHTPYYYGNGPKPVPYQTHSNIRTWKVLNPDLTSANSVKRQKQTYRAFTLKKFSGQELLDKLEEAGKIVKEEMKKLV
jgi:hypothetical protein